MIVAVGSNNPTKIRPVKKIFKKYYDDVNVIASDVSSGVSDQPLTEEETYEGALTRARNVLKLHSDADFGVGIEGGITQHVAGKNEKSIVVIINKKGEIGIGISSALFLPKRIVKLIDSGKNLTQAVDQVFGTKEIGRGIGAYGVFTKGIVTRSSGMEHAVAFALSRFLHDDLF